MKNIFDDFELDVQIIEMGNGNIDPMSSEPQTPGTCLGTCAGCNSIPFCEWPF